MVFSLVLIIGVDCPALRANFLIQVIIWGISIVGMVVYLVWRGIVHRTGLVRSRMEWPLAFWVAVLIGCWVLSENPRQGLERVAWLSGYWLIFYIFLDALDGQLDHIATLGGILLVSGAVQASAITEICYRYWQWWQAIGSWKEYPPSIYHLTSIFGTPDTYMALMNLCAPLACATLIKKENSQHNNQAGKVSAGTWLGLYLIILPFSFSLSGFLGLAGWVSVFLALWIWNRLVPQKTSLRLNSKEIRRIISSAIIVVVIVVGGFAFWQHVKAASFIGEWFRGISSIWWNAWALWKTSPLFGIGPGRFGLDILRVNKNVPPGILPTNGHNIVLQVLVEGGFAGLLASCLVSGWGVRLCRAYFRNSMLIWRPWSQAILAAGVAWFMQNLVGDFTGWISVMIPFIILVACLFTAGQYDAAIQRFPNVRLSILLLPGTILLCLAGWILWAYEPMVNGVQFMKMNKLSLAARSISTSTTRDPNLSYYKTEAGLAWADVWQKSGKDEALSQARTALMRSLDLEPTVSLVEANLGVLEWNAGEIDSAMSHLNVAMKHSPQEPSYPFNMATYLELLDQPLRAKGYYLKTLDLAPSWVNHPFWQTSELREEVQKEWLNNHAPIQASLSYWRKAIQASRLGEIKVAREMIARANWADEDILGVALARASLAEAEGNSVVAVKFYEQVAYLVGLRQLHSTSNFGDTYADRLFGRVGIDEDLVPGYMQLDENIGQFEGMGKLEEYYRQKGNCEDYYRIWSIHQIAILGGSLGDKPLPPCPGFE